MADKNSGKAPDMQKNYEGIDSSIPQNFLDIAKKTLELPENADQKGSQTRNILWLQSLMVDKASVFKIFYQLECAGLMEELREHQNYYGKGMNFIVLSTMFFSAVRFKRMTRKLVTCGGLVLLKTLWLDALCHDIYLRNIALKEDDLVSQEIRNLYRFYFPNSVHVPQMLKKSQDYLKINQIRKEIRKADL